MKTLVDIGIKMRLTPQEEIWIRNETDTIYVSDLSPIVLISEGKLEDGHIFYGMFGPVIEGHERYRGLICSILTRVDADDWRKARSTQVNFKIGPAPVFRNHAFDFRHPEGTDIVGYPVISRFGRIEVIENENGA